ITLQSITFFYSRHLSTDLISLGGLKWRGDCTQVLLSLQEVFVTLEEEEVGHCHCHYHHIQVLLDKIIQPFTATEIFVSLRPVGRHSLLFDDQRSALL
ncbi:hypothetical protein TYRP_005527, partial [Tyrophagus putrescentiae]